MRYLIVIPTLLLFAVPVQAQETPPTRPRVETFFGGSISQLNVRPNNFLGGQTSVDVNLTRFFALVGDFGFQQRHYNGFSINTEELAGGGEFRLRHLRQTFFMHLLAGGQRDGVSHGAIEVLGATVMIPSSSTRGLAVLVGGGTDIRLSRLIGLRLTSDYVATKFQQDYGQRYMRLGAGLVFRFGGPKVVAYKAPKYQDAPTPPLRQWRGFAGD
jgi:hypothetical protein